MKRYSLTSTAFDGEVLLEFNDSGLLTGYDCNGATLTEAQQLWILNRMPREIADLKRIINEAKQAKLTELEDEEVSFDKFWNRYDEKIRSSKKKTLAKWNRMPKAQRLKAYKYIATYERSLYAGVAKKYAETYLNAELWNN